MTKEMDNHNRILSEHQHECGCEYFNWEFQSGIYNCVGYSCPKCKREFILDEDGNEMVKCETSRAKET